MRFLMIVMSGGRPGPRDPDHVAKVRKANEDDIASGRLIAVGALGKRATAAARVTSQGGEITVEDPPAGDGWMAAGGYSLLDAASKEEAVATAKAKLEFMGDGVIELIQVTEMHPPPKTPGSALVEAGRAMQARGWVPATSGNLSVRHGDGALITPSGRDKGAIAPGELVEVDALGHARAGRPSAETLLHLAVYRRFPGANAILHAHSTAAVVLSRRLQSDIRLTGFELLKALDGIGSHDADVRIPVIANDQDIARLVPVVEAGLLRTGSRWAFVLTGHGIYAWGATVGDAFRHLEALDALFGCVLMETR